MFACVRVGGRRGRDSIPLLDGRSGRYDSRDRRGGGRPSYNNSNRDRNNNHSRDRDHHSRDRDNRDYKRPKYANNRSDSFHNNNRKPYDKKKAKKARIWCTVDEAQRERLRMDDLSYYSVTLGKEADL